MTRIKICGITNAEDARVAVDCGADALGFIFVPDTPRYIGSFPQRGLLLRAIPPFVSRVGVFANLSAVPSSPCVYWDALQVYDSHWLQTDSMGKHILQAERVKSASDLDGIAAALAQRGAYCEPRAILLDTYHRDKLGGAGETFNWDIAIEAKARFQLPIILAGGLTAENVGEAIARVRPYAVDVSSGVEAAPGRKDHAKVKAFCEAVRQADALLNRS